MRHGSEKEFWRSDGFPATVGLEWVLTFLTLQAIPSLDTSSVCPGEAENQGSIPFSATPRP